MPEHAVFSLHFFTIYFALFLAIAVIAKALALVAGKGFVASADPVLATGTVLAMTAYLASAEARVYGTSRTGIALRGLALALGCLLILGAYRAVLFGTTFLVT